MLAPNRDGVWRRSHKPIGLMRISNTSTQPSTNVSGRQPFQFASKPRGRALSGDLKAIGPEEALVNSTQRIRGAEARTRRKRPTRV